MFEDKSAGAAESTAGTDSTSTSASTSATATVAGDHGHGEAAGLAFGVSELIAPDHTGNTSAEAFSFAEVGGSQHGMSHFLAVAEHAIDEIQHGLADLFGSHQHAATGSAAALSAGTATDSHLTIGGETATTHDDASATAHAATAASGTANELGGFSFTLTETVPGQHGAAEMASAYGFSGAGFADISQEDLARFMQVAQHAVGEIVHALDDLLGLDGHGGGSSGGSGQGACHNHGSPGNPQSAAGQQHPHHQHHAEHRNDLDQDRHADQPVSHGLDQHSSPDQSFWNHVA